ncbi:MAG TPA: Zn-dependent alcohol dehydrogenase [Actinomycetota bacterium]|jgi:S-(hydroxymethyl)glutathione dehydrogenase/alcohol dehydrogenase|nr:Zn-dependent alcohol dehydrogenase [Actinomycetota bacterium]
MKAAVLEAYGQPLNVTDVDLASPQRGEVRVAIRATGVCHSDLSIQQGKLPFPTPCVLGHEGAGEIVEVGEGVTSVQPGDRVVLMWTLMCGNCFYCRRGQTHLCDATRAMGMMDDNTTRLSKDGQAILHAINTACFAEEAILREHAVVKIGDDIPFEVAAVVGCGVLTGVGAALYTAALRSGESAAVLGCGGVGINVIQGAKLVGANPIIAIDTVQTKLDMAQSFGATHLINASDVDAAAAVLELTAGRGADAAFEVVGVPALQRQVFDMTRRGGRAIFVGVAGLTDEVSLPSMFLTLGEKTAKGCYYGSCDPKRDIPVLLDLWKAGKLDLEGLISQTSKLEDVNGAFEDMEAGKVIRTVLTP